MDRSFFNTNTLRKTVAILLFVKIGYSPVFSELSSGPAIQYWSLFKTKIR